MGNVWLAERADSPFTRQVALKLVHPAFARLAERAELDPNTEPQSFGDYASAAERARIEDWPDGAWRDWRYRRASLARLLASQGKMHQVVSAYAQVHARYAARQPIWRRLFAAERWIEQSLNRV
ncbi:MAG: hypothetical protein ABI356_13610 [Steroidobacteraceae bacterium]